MSGGIAYVYDPKNTFVNGLCNTETIEFETIAKEDATDLKVVIEKHVLYTDSKKGSELIANWDSSLKSFCKGNAHRIQESFKAYRNRRTNV